MIRIIIIKNLVNVHRNYNCIQIDFFGEICKNSPPDPET